MLLSRGNSLAVALWAAIGVMASAQEDVLAARSREGNQALVAGRFTEAIKIYRELVGALPDNPGLRMNLGLALEKAGQPAAAIPQLEQATRAQPDFAPAWFLLGLAYQQLGKPQQAIAPLRKAVSLDGADFRARLELADAELAAGQPRDSAEGFRALTGKFPEMTKAWQGLGLSYLALGERAFTRLAETAPDSGYSDALADWLSSLAEAEKSATPENLYWASLACGSLAEQSFQHVATLPPSAEIHELLAESNQRMGRRVEAVEEWRKALAMAPDNRLQGRLAESLIRDRKYEDAEQLLSPLVAGHPENGEWQYLLGETLFEQRRADAALPHLVAAERLMPGHLPVAEVLGRVYLALGEPGKAVARLEKARPLDDGAISFALNSAYRRLGRDPEARAALARYQQLTRKTGSRTARSKSEIPAP